MFGTNHFYAVDQFNENDPRSNELTYLEACAKSQLNALVAGDPEAVWVMQGWLFVFHQRFWGKEQIEAYLSTIPSERILVLDLISEATPAYEETHWYHGKPVIWSLLHNFGGQIGLRGNLYTVMNRPYEALKLSNSTIVGLGLTMEAIHQNPVMYELALDHVWNKNARETEGWLQEWVNARYGSLSTPQLVNAWNALLRSCYNVMDPMQGNGFWGVTKSVIEKRPSMVRKNVISSGFQASILQYDACKIVEVWKLMMDDQGNNSKNTSGSMVPK